MYLPRSSDSASARSGSCGKRAATRTSGRRALRIKCTCANCQSEATGERILDPKTVPEDLTIADMHLVGNYGVGIHFSDGHTTGIFRFRELRRAR